VYAAIDVGTNTVRLLLGYVRDGKIVPKRYFRKITRLGGGLSPDKGLAPDASERTLSALREIREILDDEKVDHVWAVGTAALRTAPNGRQFLEAARAVGIPLEIIGGNFEARLSARGVVAALDPTPQSCIIFDIGGGSTEFILWNNREVLFQRSYPLGVVGLSENFPDTAARNGRIGEVMDQLSTDLGQGTGREIITGPGCILAGTAGTVTTLAAVKLKMRHYDWRRVNNLVLSEDELLAMAQKLEKLTVAQREELPGMEKGRGDLILPGLEVVLGILHRFSRAKMTVSDFGLLEGILLSMAESE
jgi:exopolyphosphatase/guanosine-5'-triphosphate,3'-diphosphate pyrophosphatase